MMVLRRVLPGMVLAACAAEPAPVPAAPAGAEVGVEVEAAAGTPWERSRGQGYAFRGIGQEPGWTVEIAPGREIRAVLEYGERTLVLPAPAPVREGGRTLYHARTESAELWVAVEEVPCEDTMSGERMTHTVTLRVDGAELRGCGRELVPAGMGQG